MESRIQILDRLSKRWGQKTNPLVESFEDFCVWFDSDAIVRLIYIAMAEYNKQSRNNRIERNREFYTDDKLEEMMIQSMKENGRWAHCFIDDKLVQRPRLFEEELAYRIDGARMMLHKLYPTKADAPDYEDISKFLTDEE